jgi:hypothetical protein
MYPNTLDDDLRLTLYRVRVVEQWPDSPLKSTLMTALNRRLRSLEQTAVHARALGPGLLLRVPDSELLE